MHFSQRANRIFPESKVWLTGCVRSNVSRGKSQLENTEIDRKWTFKFLDNFQCISVRFWVCSQSVLSLQLELINDSYFSTEWQVKNNHSVVFRPQCDYHSQKEENCFFFLKFIFSFIKFQSIGACVCGMWEIRNEYKCRCIYIDSYRFTNGVLFLMLLLLLLSRNFLADDNFLRCLLLFEIFPWRRNELQFETKMANSY